MRDLIIPCAALVGLFAVVWVVFYLPSRPHKPRPGAQPLPRSSAHPALERAKTMLPAVSAGPPLLVHTMRTGDSVRIEQHPMLKVVGRLMYVHDEHGTNPSILLAPTLGIPATHVLEVESPNQYVFYVLSAAPAALPSSEDDFVEYGQKLCRPISTIGMQAKVYIGDSLPLRPYLRLRYDYRCFFDDDFRLMIWHIMDDVWQTWQGTVVESANIRHILAPRT